MKTRVLPPYPRTLIAAGSVKPGSLCRYADPSGDGISYVRLSDTDNEVSDLCSPFVCVEDQHQPWNVGLTVYLPSESQMTVPENMTVKQ